MMLWKVGKFISPMNALPGYIWLEEGFSYNQIKALFMDTVGMKNYDVGNHLQ